MKIYVVHQRGGHYDDAYDYPLNGFVSDDEQKSLAAATEYANKLTAEDAIKKGLMEKVQAEVAKWTIDNPQPITPFPNKPDKRAFGI